MVNRSKTQKLLPDLAHKTLKYVSVSRQTCNIHVYWSCNMTPMLSNVLRCADVIITLSKIETCHLLKDKSAVIYVSCVKGILQMR